MVLVYLLVRQFGRVSAVLGGVYAMLMSIGVVYLGEHYVLDMVGGWMFAVAGWLLAKRIRANETGRRVIHRPEGTTGPYRASARRSGRS